MDYNFRDIEKKWQKNWEDEHVLRVENDPSKPKYYVLDMFPYPSGAGLHVGHPLGYIASDIFSRFKRLKGFNVLHPMGWDAFGLPAEQYAIQTGQHPAITTEQNLARYRSQMDMLGLSYDWSREVKTSDPKFYKWTQWIFLKLFKSWYNNIAKKAEPIDALISQFEKSGTTGINAACGEDLNFSAAEWKSFDEKKKSDILFNYRLAYLSEAWVNWCPALGTVLANDEVKDGVSERGGYPVERKLMPQWSLRMTAYADRLLNDLDTIDWSESIKEAQRNWIGRSEGCSLQFKAPLSPKGGNNKSIQLPPLEGGEASEATITVFTTRPDTVFGVTFITLAPENDLVNKITPASHKAKVDEYVNTAKNKTERERQAEKKVSGEFTGAYAIHPFTGNKIPVWVGDYVLAGYGTGAVMGVPAHDSRDHAFAKHFKLPAIQVIAHPPPEGGSPKTLRGESEVSYGYETADPSLYGRIKEFSKQHRSVPTESENIFWQLVRGKSLEGYKFRRQHIIGQYIADFVCLQCKLVVEIDGLIHELPENKVSDEERTHFLTKNGFHVIRFTNNEVIGNPEGVLEKVVNELKNLSKQLPPSEGGEAYDGKTGKCINSDFLNGLEVKDAIKRIIEEIEKRDLGKGKVNFRLRDAAFGRQRYWGEPIPIYYKDGIPCPVDENDLPVELPKIDNFKPTETGDPPLARATNWKYRAPLSPKGGNGDRVAGDVSNIPPSEGGEASYHYEYTTMPGWAGSSWYYLRYEDPNNDKEFASQKAIDYWKNVDLYIGGSEHATGHLIYVRFWTKFLNDYNLVPFAEPAKKLVNQGMIQGESKFIYMLVLDYMRHYDENTIDPVFVISKEIYEKIKGNTLSPEESDSINNFCKEQFKRLNPSIPPPNMFSANRNSHFVSRASTHRVDINLVHDNKLDILGFKKWYSKFDNVFFYPDEGAYYCATEVEKMSKSKWNVVTPDDVIRDYGADTMRMYEMFLGPLEMSKPWSTQGISGVHNFLKKLWKMVAPLTPEGGDNDGINTIPPSGGGGASRAELKCLHKLIKKIDEDIERLSFNTAVSAFMICLNELHELKCNKREILEPLLICLSPFAPHIAEELWSKLGHSTSILKASYPKFEESYLVENTFAYPVSFNGKTRFMLELPLNLTKEQIEKEVLSSEDAKKWIKEANVKKVIVVPNKIVNIVVG